MQRTRITLTPLRHEIWPADSDPTVISVFGIGIFIGYIVPD